MRVTLPLLLLPLCLSLSRAEDRPRVTINVHADVVEYDHEMGTVAVKGQVELTARADDPRYPTISMAADEVEGDLRQGRIIAGGGVKVLSQDVALRGDRVDINLQTDEVVVTHGAASADRPSPAYPGSILRAYFFGDEIMRKADVIFVIEGRVTTCDRRPPHYSIGFKKITYDMRKGVGTLHGARASLYGMKLMLPVTFILKIGDRDRERKKLALPLMIPSYSADDGLYFNVPFRWGKAEDPWQVRANVRAGTKLRLPFTLEASHDDENSELSLLISRRETVTWDLNKRSRLNRYPELRYLWHLQKPVGGESPLDLEFFGGYLQERGENLPQVEAGRWGASVRYSPMPQRRADRRGWWWAASANQSFYSTGEALTDVQLELGAGKRFSDRFAAALWGVHHETNGQTPFLFDDVWTENEGFAALSVGLTPHYSVEAIGRYDFDRDSLRDYSLKLSRRLHCLTWNVEYNFARQGFSLGVDLNGLTGETKPPDSAPLVSPEEVPPLPEPAVAPVPAPETAPPTEPPVVTTPEPGTPETAVTPGVP